MRLDEIAKRHAEMVRFEWRAYLLRPQPEPRTIEAFRRYTESWRRPDSLEPSVTFNVWASDEEPPSHSVPAAIAGKAAAAIAPEHFDAFHLALMKAYFTDNRTVSADDVIADVASSVGIDAGELSAYTATNRQALETEVVSDHRTAWEAGVTGVPALMVGEWPIVGAQDAELYERIVVSLAERSR